MRENGNPNFITPDVKNRRADRVRRRYDHVIMIEMPAPVKSRMKMMHSHKSFDETPDVGYSNENGGHRPPYGI